MPQPQPVPYRLTDSRLANMGATVIYDAYATFSSNFQAITHRAHNRFATRDWNGHRTDARQRLDLYRQVISHVATPIHNLLARRYQDKLVWASMKSDYSSVLAQQHAVGYIHHQAEHEAPALADAARLVHRPVEQHQQQKIRMRAQQGAAPRQQVQHQRDQHRADQQPERRRQAHGIAGGGRQIHQRPSLRRAGPAARSAAGLRSSVFTSGRGYLLFSA